MKSQRAAFVTIWTKLNMVKFAQFTGAMIFIACVQGMNTKHRNTTTILFHLLNCWHCEFFPNPFEKNGAFFGFTIPFQITEARVLAISSRLISLLRKATKPEYAVYSAPSL